MAGTTGPISAVDFFSTANTELEAAFQDIFGSGAGIAGSHTDYTDASAGHTGTTLELNVVGSVPKLAEWVGARNIEGLRGYKLTAKRKKYSKGLAISVTDYDSQGAEPVRKRVNDFLPTCQYEISEICHDFLVSNPDCYDGQSLYSASHPHGLADATQSNLTSADLSLSTAYAAINAMRRLTDSRGRLIGINPNQIRVGGLLLPRALEIFQAESRVVSVDFNGAETGNRIAAANAPNVYKGILDVVHDPLITDYTAYIQDTTKAAKPILLREIAGGVDMTAMIAKTDVNVLHNDEYQWFVTWRSILCGGAWQVIHKIAGTA